jgi:hypothetical protein
MRLAVGDDRIGVRIAEPMGEPIELSQPTNNHVEMSGELTPREFGQRPAVPRMAQFGERLLEPVAAGHLEEAAVNKALRRGRGPMQPSQHRDQLPTHSRHDRCSLPPRLAVDVLEDRDAVALIESLGRAATDRRDRGGDEGQSRGSQIDCSRIRRKEALEHRIAIRAQPGFDVHVVARHKPTAGIIGMTDPVIGAAAFRKVTEFADPQPPPVGNDPSDHLLLNSLQPAAHDRQLSHNARTQKVRTSRPGTQARVPSLPCRSSALTMVSNAPSSHHT